MKAFRKKQRDKQRRQALMNSIQPLNSYKNYEDYAGFVKIIFNHRNDEFSSFLTFINEKSSLDLAHESYPNSTILPSIAVLNVQNLLVKVEFKNCNPTRIEFLKYKAIFKKSKELRKNLESVVFRNSYKFSGKFNKFYCMQIMALLVDNEVNVELIPKISFYRGDIVKYYYFLRDEKKESFVLNNNLYFYSSHINIFSIFEDDPVMRYILCFHKRLSLELISKFNQSLTRNENVFKGYILNLSKI